MDEKVIRAWANEQVRLRKELLLASIAPGGEVATLTVDIAGVQLLRGARKVAGALGVQCVQVRRHGLHGIYNRTSLTYNGIEFFELEKVGGT